MWNDLEGSLKGFTNIFNIFSIDQIKWTQVMCVHPVRIGFKRVLEGGLAEL